MKRNNKTIVEEVSGSQWGEKGIHKERVRPSRPVFSERIEHHRSGDRHK